MTTRRSARGLVALTEAVRPSQYFDDARVADAADFVRCAHLLPRHGAWEMSAVSLGLRGVAGSALASNRTVRSRLRALLDAQDRSSVIGGVFGKTAWALHPAGQTLALDDGMTAVTTGLPEERSQQRVHASMWMLSVLSARARRLDGLSGETTEQWLELIHAIQAASAETLDFLKCFTQPPLWPALAPEKASRWGTDRDRYFPFLLSEAQFRLDQGREDPSALAVIVTDVDGLFIKGLHESNGALRVDDRRPSLQLGIGAAILLAARERTDPLALLAARVTVSRELGTTLRSVGSAIADAGGKCYFTHGDGVTALVPRSRMDVATTGLSTVSTPLPVSWAMVRATGDIEGDVSAAEAAIRQARLRRRSVGGNTFLDQWQARKYGIDVEHPD